MDFPETPTPNGMSENNEEQKGTPIIKNEFLSTYINELNEAKKDFNEHCVENDNESNIYDILKEINNNVNKILVIMLLKDSINSKDLKNLKKYTDKLNELQSADVRDESLIEPLYRIVLNCHSILNEVKCQYYEHKNMRM